MGLVLPAVKRTEKSSGATWDAGLHRLRPCGSMDLRSLAATPQGTWKMRWGIIAGLLGTLAVLAAAGLLVIVTGAYNVAATDPHAEAARWALETTMENSVKRRAADLNAPARVTPAMIAAGAAEYKAMCQHCHGGPGVSRAEWAQGMLPLPPALGEEAAEWRTPELFWIVKHGIKMTGMPAFGPTHDDGTMWNIAAFVAQLPTMTTDRYAAFPEGHGGGHGGSGHGGGDRAGGEANAQGAGHGAPGHTH